MLERDTRVSMTVEIETENEEVENEEEENEEEENEEVEREEVEKEEVLNEEMLNEEMFNEEIVTRFEECETSEHISLQNRRDPCRTDENVSCTEQENNKEMEERLQELEEEPHQQLEESEKETKNEEEESDVADEEEVENLEDILGKYRQFQVGCYVDLKENCEDSNGNSQSTLLQRFKCMTCFKVFSSLNHLDDHWEDCERSEECVDPLELVSQDYKDPKHENVERSNENISHVQSKADTVRNRQSFYKKNKKHVCELCNITFPKVVLLRKHVLKEHGYRERRFACSVCPKRFIDQYELKYHMRIHSENDAFQCKACLKKFARPSALRTHERSHTGEKPFMCNACPKKFSQLYSLITHERIHTGEKPYKCQYCSRAFTQHSSLRKHERIHAGGAKLFQCDICRRMYRDIKEMELHRSTHNGELPWKCAFCEHKAFRKPSELSNHVHRFHTESRPFQCDLCNKSFISACELKSHSVTHNPDRITACSGCGKTYKNRLTLRRHQCKGDRVEDDLDVKYENLKD